MNRFIEYAIFFLTMVVLQVFLFNNLNLSVYIHPMVYLAIIILLPLETPSIVVLLSGFVLGASIDALSGTAGLATIATLLTAFARPLISVLTIGKDMVKDGGLPRPDRLGRGKFLKYITLMVLIQSIIYFSFEALSFRYFHLTLLKIVASCVVTLPFVWLSRMLFIGNYAKSSGKL